MITTCHGFFRQNLFRKIFPCWGQAVIAISKPVAQHLSEDFKVPQEKICLIANGIDLDRFGKADEKQRQSVRQKWNIGDGPLIGIIARLSDVKGISVLIKAMPNVLKEIPSANLMIVGQGPEEDFLKKLTQEMSLTAHVRFENAISQTPELLPAFDVFVMPSLMEGLGLSVMEAQACGIPVVASRVGGLVDLIEEGVSGFLVESNDPTALANRIIEMLRNPDQAKKMALQARSKVEKYFSAEVMVQQTAGIYNRINS
jgi:glycosyltransferase involved in cell wall biosynthesis